MYVEATRKKQWLLTIWYEINCKTLTWQKKQHEYTLMSTSALLARVMQQLMQSQAWTWSGWWFQHHLKNIIVKLIQIASFPQIGIKIKKYFKPLPQWYSYMLHTLWDTDFLLSSPRPACPCDWAVHWISKGQRKAIPRHVNNFDNFSMVFATLGPGQEDSWLGW